MSELVWWSYRITWDSGDIRGAVIGNVAAPSLVAAIATALEDPDVKQADYIEVRRAEWLPKDAA